MTSDGALSKYIKISIMYIIKWLMTYLTPFDGIVWHRLVFPGILFNPFPLNKVHGGITELTGAKLTALIHRNQSFDVHALDLTDFCRKIIFELLYSFCRL